MASQSRVVLKRNTMTPAACCVMLLAGLLLVAAAATAAAAAPVAVEDSRHQNPVVKPEISSPPGPNCPYCYAYNCEPSECHGWCGC